MEILRVAYPFEFRNKRIMLAREEQLSHIAPAGSVL